MNIFIFTALQVIFSNLDPLPALKLLNPSIEDIEDYQAKAI